VVVVAVVAALVVAVVAALVVVVVVALVVLVVAALVVVVVALAQDARTINTTMNDNRVIQKTPLFMHASFLFLKTCGKIALDLILTTISNIQILTGKAFHSINLDYSQGSVERGYPLLHLAWVSTTNYTYLEFP